MYSSRLFCGDITSRIFVSFCAFSHHTLTFTYLFSKFGYDTTFMFNSHYAAATALLLLLHLVKFNQCKKLLG